uniref:Capsid protein n=1 Tax=Myotis mistacinus feces associated smacovirus 5 TaxID=3140003 RepID=A0AAU6S507_9VIRU
MINMTTNYATAKYQEIYDVNTVSNEVSIIAIHTPVGSKPRAMLSGFFSQFRKYKYKGCSVVGTPAQRLGLQMTDISVEAGTSGVNPKDVFNPALVRGCHGDNLNAALNSIYKGSFEQEGSSIGMDQHGKTVVPVGSLSWEQMYYRMLQDPSFKKFNLSSGIKLGGLHPMIYNVASNHQILPNESTDRTGQLTPASDATLANIDFDQPTHFLMSLLTVLDSLLLHLMRPLLTSTSISLHRVLSLMVLVVLLMCTLHS